MALESELDLLPRGPELANVGDLALRQLSSPTPGPYYTICRKGASVGL